MNGKLNNGYPNIKKNKNKQAIKRNLFSIFYLLKFLSKNILSNYFNNFLKKLLKYENLFLNL